ncbi:MAG: hypothetical protein MI739_12770 [Bacteroidales bacterium]|nr:hypothetical protein [Bacteroidales bacterium]
MKKTGIILSLVLGLTSCIQTKYFVKSEKDLSLINWECNILNFLPIKNSDLENSPVLKTSYDLIVSKQYSKLNEYLSSIQTKNSEFYLCKTLYYISKTKYNEAFINLKKIDETSYSLIRDLLFVDLNYELEKQYNSENYNKHLQDYQKIIDKYPDNEYLKKIIALRVRYIRYNY